MTLPNTNKIQTGSHCHRLERIHGLTGPPAGNQDAGCTRDGTEKTCFFLPNDGIMVTYNTKEVNRRFLVSDWMMSYSAA